MSDLNVVQINKQLGLLLSAVKQTPDIIPDDPEDGKKRKRQSSPGSSLIGVLIHRSSLSYELDGEVKPLDKDDRIESLFSIGGSINARIKGYHLVEGYAVASNNENFLQESLLHSSEVEIGQVIEATITAIQDVGLDLTIGSRIKAFCPSQHTSDTISSIKLSKRFKVGQGILVRVSEIKGKDIRVTHKKSLVNDSLPPLVAYEEAIVGQRACGVATKLFDNGIVVHFYNGVNGLIPITVLAKQGVIDVEESYRLGQVVKCVVIKIDHIPSAKYPWKITLALDIGDTKNLIDFMNESNDDKISSQSVSSNGLDTGIVYKVQDDGYMVRLTDGRAGYLSKHHMNDYGSQSSRLTVGMTLNDILVLSDQGKQVVLTMKPLLVHTVKMKSSATDSLPKSFSDLSPGITVVGYVSKVDNTGVFVRFRDNLTALAPRPNIADKFITNPSDVFSPYLSVRCVVQRADLVKERAIVTFKSMLVGSSTGVCCFLRSYFKETYEAYETSNDQSIIDWKTYSIGNTTTASVTSVKSYGTILLASDGVTMMLAKGYVGSNEGDELIVRVLDLDYSGKCLDVVISDTKKNTKKKTKTPSIGVKVTAKVISIKEKYSIVSVDDSIGYLMIADYHCPRREASELTVNQDVVVTTAYLPPSKSSETNAAFPQSNSMIFSLYDENETRSQVNRVQLEAEKSDAEHHRAGIALGEIHDWIVDSISPLEVKLKYANSSSASVIGTLHLSQAIESTIGTDSIGTDIAPKSNRDGISSKHPFALFKEGQMIKCRALQIRRDGTGLMIHVGLDISSVVWRPLIEWKGRNSIDEKKVYAAVVTKITPSSVSVAISPYIHSTLSLLDVSDDKDVIHHFKKNSFVGQKIIVGVASIHKNAGSKSSSVSVTRVGIEKAINSSQLTDLMSSPSVVFEEDSTLKIGSIVTGLVTLQRRPDKPPAIAIALRNNLTGRVCLTELADPDKWDDCVDAEAGSRISDGDVVRCVVLAKDLSLRSIDLSTRPSRLAASKKLRTEDDAMPAPGSLIKAYVTNTSTKGCFVRISRSISGRIMIKDLSDTFVSNPVDLYPPGKLVLARVKGVNESEQTVELSLRSSDVNGDGKLAEMAALFPGKEVSGQVQKVTEFGVFVSIDGTTLVGLSRTTDAVSNGLAVVDMYKANDAVRARVLKISGYKISLGLHERFFRANYKLDEDVIEGVETLNDEDAETDGDDDDGMSLNSADDNVNNEDEDEMDALVRAAHVKSVDEDDDDNEEDHHIKVIPPFNATTTSTLAAVKSEPSIFEWDDFKPVDKKITTHDEDQQVHDEEEEEDSNDDDDDGDDNAMSGSRKKAKRSRDKESIEKRKESELWNQERSLESRVPEKSEDYERLLMSSPNSSFIWMQYMAHYLLAADVDAARRVADKALQTISFREEDEKFNIWVAYLNLEHKYGTMASLERVFSRGIQESKGKFLFLSLADTYESTGDTAGAAAVLERALKRHRKSKKVWMRYHSLYIRQGDDKKAKELLARSMQSLSRHKHVEVISKYALAEFEFGSVDRARVLFEDLLSSYPKRSDLWLVYVDKEAKLGYTSQARQIFERMVHCKFGTKGMKEVFKKFLRFEDKFGNVEDQERVKELAKQYVSGLV